MTQTVSERKRESREREIERGGERQRGERERLLEREYLNKL